MPTTANQATGQPNGTAPPPFPVGGPASSAWREEVLTKAQELQGLSRWMRAGAIRRGHGRRSLLRRAVAQPVSHDGDELFEATHRHLEAAQKTAARQDGRSRPSEMRASFSGSSFERALGHLDAAETNLIRLAPASYVRGEMPNLEAHVQRFLPANDPRCQKIGEVTRAAGRRNLQDFELDTVVAAYHAASTQRRRDLIRLRSFRNVILVAAGLLLVVAIAFAVLGALQPDKIPLCFNPETPQNKVVCPSEENPTDGRPVDVVIDETATAWDMPLVAALGLVAGALTAGIGLRRIRGTSTPYNVQVALALLKLPTGALTAMLGLLLMRADFVPGLSALDSSAQILGWAVIFGSAQQLFTRFVDIRANSVLEAVSGRGSAGQRAPSSSSGTAPVA
jgi:hypothetical protein